jgi:glycosyltransferase involved in cell wall biosynthesis
MLRSKRYRKAASAFTFSSTSPTSRCRTSCAPGDLFVLCSLKEMMPIALLEALATGLPALVSQHPVVSWMKGDGGAAIDMRQKGSVGNCAERVVRCKPQSQCWRIREASCFR